MLVDTSRIYPTHKEAEKVNWGSPDRVKPVLILPLDADAVRALRERIALACQMHTPGDVVGHYSEYYPEADAILKTIAGI